MSESPEEQEKEPRPPAVSVQQLMYPMGPMGMPSPVNMNLALFMQQQHIASASGRHSAPALPTVGVAQLPPVPPLTSAVAAPQKKRKASSKATEGKDETKQKAVASRKTKGGGKATHCTSQEKMTVCDVVSEKLPIGNPCWESIEDMHNRRVPEDRSRDLPSIRRQWNSLWRCKIPTGNPTCPPHVKRAKAIQCQITTKAGLIVGEDMSDDSGLLDETITGNENSFKTAEDMEESELAVLTHEATGADAIVQDKAALAKAKREAKARQKLVMTTGRGKSDSQDIIAAMQELDKVQAEREERREKRQDKRDKKNMKMFMGLVAALASNNSNSDRKSSNRRSGNNKSTSVNRMLQSLESDATSSDESDISSIKESDSPPTKRSKLAAKKLKE